jgi:hypothetical protein
MYKVLILWQKGRRMQREDGTDLKAYCRTDQNLAH